MAKISLNSGICFKSVNATRNFSSQLILYHFLSVRDSSVLSIIIFFVLRSEPTQFTGK